MRRTTVVLVVLLAVLLGACASKPIPKPEIVYVPTYMPPPELPMPAGPGWETCEADPADWQEYLRAMTEDLLAAWSYIAELQHTIEAYNAARSQPD